MGVILRITFSMMDGGGISQDLLFTIFVRAAYPNFKKGTKNEILLL